MISFAFVWLLLCAVQTSFAQVTLENNDYSGNEYVGSSATSSVKELIIRTNGNERLRFLNNTPGAGAIFQVGSKDWTFGNVTYSRFIGFNTNYDGTNYSRFSNTDGMSMMHFGVGGDIYFEVQGTTGTLTGTSLLLLDHRGLVCIGSNSGVNWGNYANDYKLYVATGIRTEKIRVDLKSSWPDFVFNKHYSLRSLSEVETYITANHHLPDVPSEQTVKAEGMDLGEMQGVLLRKIEELTLYLIDLEKQQKQTAAENLQLQSEIAQLKQQVSVVQKE